MYSMSSCWWSIMDLDLWLRVLSIVEAADCRMGVISLSRCPRCRRRRIKLLVMLMKSSGEEFWFQYLNNSPTIRPLKQLVGWAEVGGMYRYKLRSFWNVVVCIFWFFIVIVRSRKVVEEVRSSIFHCRVPKPFSWVLKSSQELCGEWYRRCIFCKIKGSRWMLEEYVCFRELRRWW